MDENKLQANLRRLSEGLPRFSDGRIDYSNADTAPVIGIIVKYGQKILIVKRSQKVSFYPGKWNWISGFLDEPKPLKEFAEKELEEETGIKPSQIIHINFTPVIKETDRDINKTWLIHPAVATLRQAANPRLDWEADDFDWIQPERLDRYDTVPGVARNIRAALGSIHP